MQSLIYLLRHGEIDRPSPRRFLGQTDLALNENGIHQARALGEALGSLPFSRVFSSPLKRAMQTAALVSGHSMDSIQTIAAFREIDLGAWEGLTVAEVQARFPGAYAQRGLDMEHFRPLDGESFADLAARVLPAFSAIVRACPGPILIVAHAGVNRVLLARLQHLPLNTLLQIPQDYGAVNILRKNPEELTVAAINHSLTQKDHP